jgi:enoyl-CoA hydratase/carnithine racemase
MSQSIVTTVADGVLHIELADPAGVNGMDNEMFAALDEAFRLGDDDASVRVMLLSSRGKIFSAGANLKSIAGTSGNPVPQDLGSWPANAVIRTLARATKPTVAAVHGAAAGGGATILLSCDFVVAAEGTRFQLPFAQLGLSSELASSYLLPMFVGMRKAREWLLLAEPFDAAEALQAGFINAVVPREQLMDRAGQYVSRLKANAPRSMRTIKRLLMHSHMAAVDAILEDEGALIREGFGSEEMKEAISAFLDRRKPDFSRFS